MDRTHINLPKAWDQDRFQSLHHPAKLTYCDHCKQWVNLDQPHLCLNENIIIVAAGATVGNPPESEVEALRKLVKAQHAFITHLMQLGLLRGSGMLTDRALHLVDEFNQLPDE